MPTEITSQFSDLPPRYYEILEVPFVHERCRWVTLTFMVMPRCCCGWF